MLFLICISLVAGSLLWAVLRPGSGLVSAFVVVSSALLVTVARAFATARDFLTGTPRSSW